MKEHPHILIAEDDAPIRNGLVDALESEGYRVTAVSDGRAALDHQRADPAHLVILDIMMPEVNGYDVCRNLRQQDHHTPILLLTAKGEEIDKVVGLELGADDYVTKPFGLRELLARIHALLRRTYSGKDHEAMDKSDAPFSFGHATVTPRRYEVTLDTNTRNLSAREITLLRYFVGRPGEVLTRDELLNAGWGVTYYGTTRTLDQHIAQLRKKVEVNPKNPQTIQTIHGVGYRYTGTQDS